jgi:PqqA peptide cyclase
VSTVLPPLALLAELTHRCPLACPYCSNPLRLTRRSGELPTEAWARVFAEAARLGVLQLHLSGGEPMARDDLPALVAAAARNGLYSNLITSGVLLDPARLEALVEAGLEHVQLSFQDVETEPAERLGGMAGAQALKLEAARLVVAAGLPLTLNFVVHRQNLARLPAMVALGEELGARRIEIAHVQYYGWALVNRAALLPSRAQLDAATATVEAARARLGARMTIDYVVPDYYAQRPKPCMGGWGQRVMVVTPRGLALPCHAAETLPGLDFPSVLAMPLAEIWHRSDAFERYRGTGWMRPPCRDCERRELDWGGCRCQALALTGDAARADPACALSPDHGVMAAAVASAADMPLRYRGFDVA